MSNEPRGATRVTKPVAAVVIPPLLVLVLGTILAPESATASEGEVGIIYWVLLLLGAAAALLLAAAGVTVWALARRHERRSSGRTQHSAAV